jgi:Domain of unknown function DUF11
LEDEMLALIPIFAAAVFPPTITKSFSPPTVSVNQTSLMAITITNPNTSDLTGARLDDFFPAGLVNIGAATTTCPSGSVTITSTPPHLVFFGTIPANGSCTITTLVESFTPGSYENLTGNLFSSGPSSLFGGDAILAVVPSIPTMSPKLLLLLALVLAAIGARLTA